MFRLSFLILLSSFIFADEVSIFGAGNLDDTNPYGLTQSEKKILENKKKLDKLSQKERVSKRKIDSIENSIEILQELVRGIGQQNNAHKKQISNLIDDLQQNHLITEINYKKIEEKMKKTDSKVQATKIETKKTLNEKIEDSFAQVNKALEKQNQRLIEIENGFNTDFLKMKNKIKKIGSVIDKINKQYVTQKQLDFIVEDFNRFKETVIGEFEKLSKDNDNYYDFSRHTNQEIFKKGKKNIQLGKYQEAVKLFSYLITKHYRPATDNFYIGESNYFLGNYEQAIKHYKESVAIYDKSKFMPTLLLHSGISLEKIRDVAQAKGFYSVLISTYGDLPEGKKAKKLLEQLQ